MNSAVVLHGVTQRDTPLHSIEESPCSHVALDPLDVVCMKTDETFETVGVETFDTVGVETFDTVGVETFDTVGVETFDTVGVETFDTDMERDVRATARLLDVTAFDTT